jgi:hypothetical protein
VFGAICAKAHAGCNSWHSIHGQQRSILQIIEPPTRLRPAPGCFANPRFTGLLGRIPSRARPNQQMERFRHQDIAPDAEAPLGAHWGEGCEEVPLRTLGVEDARATVGAGRQIGKVTLAVIAMRLRHPGMLTLSSFADADTKRRASAPPARRLGENALGSPSANLIQPPETRPRAQLKSRPDSSGRYGVRATCLEQALTRNASRPPAPP